MGTQMEGSHTKLECNVAVGVQSPRPIPLPLPGLSFFRLSVIDLSMAVTRIPVHVPNVGYEQMC